MSKEGIFFTRHLDEEDDLVTWRRDAPLKQDEANHAKLENIVEVLAGKVERDDKKAILFVTSPRLRAIETAHLAAKGISQKIGGGLKFRFSTDEGLKATEQGEILLPEDYSAGDFFEGLDLAGKIFGREVFGDGSLVSKHNLHYRFGDPVVERK